MFKPVNNIEIDNVTVHNSASQTFRTTVLLTYITIASPPQYYIAQSNSNISHTRRSKSKQCVATTAITKSLHSRAKSQPADTLPELLTSSPFPDRYYSGSNYVHSNQPILSRGRENCHPRVQERVYHGEVRSTGS